MILTDSDRKKLKELYISSISEGFQTCTGLILNNGTWITSAEYWDKSLKENFEGETLEHLLDKFVRKPRKGFITGKDYD